MVFIKIKTTRDKDLEWMAETRKKMANRKKANELLDKVYCQSKNSSLEYYRKLLIEAHKRRDFKRIEEIENYIKRKFG